MSFGGNLCSASMSLFVIPFSHKIWSLVKNMLFCQFFHCITIVWAHVAGFPSLSKLFKKIIRAKVGKNSNCCSSYSFLAHTLAFAVFSMVTSKRKLNCLSGHHFVLHKSEHLREQQDHACNCMSHLPNACLGCGSKQFLNI